MAKKILILAANSRDTVKLRVNQEFEAIKKIFKDNRKFIVEENLAVTPNNLFETLSEHKPDIVHFIGHGLGENGVVLEGDDDFQHVVSSKGFTSTFEHFKLDCLYLNFCSSVTQAWEIHEFNCVKYIVYMQKKIENKTAKQLSVEFYKGVAQKKDYKSAFNFAKKTLGPCDLSGLDIPKIIYNSELILIGKLLSFVAVLVIVFLIAGTGLFIFDKPVVKTTDEELKPENCNYDIHDIKTMVACGDAYRKGEKGFPKDYEKAIEFYKKPADKGDPDAITHFAYMYEIGLGMKKNETKAVELYTKAAIDHKHPIANLKLARLYNDGIGVKQNKTKADFFYRRANDFLSFSADNAKDFIEQLLELAKQGNANAQYELGLLYEQGLIVAKDKKVAMEWFRKAAKQGHEKALLWLPEKSALEKPTKHLYNNQLNTDKPEMLKFYLVIDNTASMMKEIKGIEIALTEYIEYYIFKNVIPYSSALLTFKDKDEIKLHVMTNKPDKLLKHLQLLRVGGGGTCPEDSIVALGKAAREISELGTILIVTDAPPHENKEELTVLIKKLQDNMVNINIILTKPGCNFEKSVEIYSYIVNEVGNNSKLNIIEPYVMERGNEWLQSYKNTVLDILFQIKEN